jgi:hypothetical protein
MCVNAPFDFAVYQYTSTLEREFMGRTVSVRDDAGLESIRGVRSCGCIRFSIRPDFGPEPDRPGSQFQYSRSLKGQRVSARTGQI